MIYQRFKADGKPYPHWWFRFKRSGVHYRVNTRQGSKNTAKELEADYRTKLARDEAGFRDVREIPTLKGFEQRFNEAIEARCPKNTAKFYRGHLASILAYPPIGNARIDRIDEALIEKFIHFRRKQIAHPERKSSTNVVTPATVNRALAVLRRALRLAQEWKVIARVPRIKMLPGERNREFVLTRDREQEYLQACPELLKDMALLILDTGLRVGEATRLEWRDVHLDPVGGTKFGYLQVRKGKSKNATRTISLTERVVKMLKQQAETITDKFVFRQCTPTYLCRLHSRVREKMGLPADFVIHSLRHTMLTRLGEAGVDAFTIMRIAGHSSITVSQRYIHPSTEAMERAFEKLEAANSASGTERAHEPILANEKAA